MTHLKSTQQIFIFIVLLHQIVIQAREFPPATVNVVAAELKSLAPIAWVSGTVISRNQSQISAEVEGRLITLVDLGEKVSEGQVIAQIDDRSLLIKKNENLANISNAESKYKFLKSEVNRLTSLAKRNLSSKKDVDEAISKSSVAKGDLEIARSRLAQSIQDIDYSQVKAPFAGIISQRLSNLGEYVSRGKAIILLVETEHLEASVYAPLTAYRFLTKTKFLAVESPLGKGTAPIKSLIPVASTRSHLMEVRLDMSAMDWPVGLNIKVAVANGEKIEALAIPRDSLVLRRNGSSIFRINSDNTAEQIDVSIGIGSGDYVQVIGDVKEGDLIVIRGAERLQDGQKVQIKSNNKRLISGQNGQ